MTKIQERALMRKIKRTQKKKDMLSNQSNKRKEDDEVVVDVEEEDGVSPIGTDPPKSKFAEM